MTSSEENEITISATLRIKIGVMSHLKFFGDFFYYYLPRAGFRDCDLQLGLPCSLQVTDTPGLLERPDGKASRSLGSFRSIGRTRVSSFITMD